MSVIRMLRDPAYLVSLAVLLGVLAISLGFTGASTRDPHASTPPTLAQVLLDSRRALDLAADGAALEAYRVRYGAYPSSDGIFITFCNAAYDPGCQVTFVTTTISGGDGSYPYWYRSDGKTYTLFARLQTPLDDSHCPGEVPPLLVGVPVFCVSASGGIR